MPKEYKRWTRTSVIKDMIKEMDMLNKENVKSKILLTQNTQEIRNTMKKANLRIIGIVEREEIQFKGQENIFNKVRKE